MNKLINIFLLLLLISLASCKNEIVIPDIQPDPDLQIVQIHHKFSFLDELNTFENTFQKDLVMDGIIKVNFWLTEEEQNRILTKANEINFFELPENFERDSNVVIVPDPGKQFLRIKYKEQDKTCSWYYLSIEKESLQLNSVKELASLIQEIIYNKREYKALPPGRGARF